MTPAPLRPTEPPLWLRLVIRLHPARHREALLGDLLEEYATRARSGPGEREARTWLIRKALVSGGWGLAHRAYDLLRALPGGLGDRGVHEAAAGRTGPTSASSHGGRSLADLLGQDLRYAARRLFARPGFTAVAVISLGLGIGANTALFTVVDTLLLEGVGAESPETLVEIYTSEEDGYPYSTSSYPDYFDLRDGSGEVFQDVMSYAVTFAQTEVDGADPRLRLGEIVSANYFDVLGVSPAVGRGFAPDESRTPDAHAVVVLGWEFWQRTFGGDPAVVGRSLRILRRPYTVVGVAPEGFGGMWPGVVPDFYVPEMMTDHISRTFGGSRLGRRGMRSLFLKGRLQPGVTSERAAEWVAAFSRRLAEAHPETNEGRIMTALPSEDVSFHPFVDRALLPVTGLLFGVVGLVLLIACTNLVGFLLARGEDRKKEIAVRLALGARRSTLVRQLLTETVLLGMLGGAAGLLLAQATVAALLSFQPPVPLPLHLDVELDGSAFVFALAVAFVVGLLFGLLPALQSTRPEVAPTLRDEAGGATGTRRRWSLRNGLVVVQVSLSFVLLIGAGLFARSLQKAQAIDPGFDTGGAVLLWPNLEMSLIDADQGSAVWDELLRVVGSVPGVEQAALTDRMPLGLGVQALDVLPEGVPPPEALEAWEVDHAVVDERFFEVLGVPLLRGRGFGPADRPDSEPVVIVSDAFVRRFWPGESGLGKTVQRDGVAHRVVGVARDAKVRTLGEKPRPLIYFHHLQDYTPVMYVVVRGSMPEDQLLVRVRNALRVARPDLVILDAKTMTQHLGLPLYGPRAAAILLGVFGLLALLLSAIGLYGVVSHAVARRTREVGIRMSLGADPRLVVRMVVGSGMRLVAFGAAAGMVLSATVTWLLSRFLYGVSPLDLATFILIPILLCGVAAGAAFIPATRASKVEPVEALRAE